MVRVEVQGFEGLVVEGMQQLLRRKQVGFGLSFNRTHPVSLSLLMYSVLEAPRQHHPKP